MKKIGNRPITEADTDFSKLQKNEIKNRKIKKNPKNFRKIFGIFFPIFLLLSYFLSYKEVCDYFFYFMNLMNSMFIKHIKSLIKKCLADGRLFLPLKSAADTDTDC